jgi:hypothetical protein
MQLFQEGQKFEFLQNKRYPATVGLIIFNIQTYSYIRVLLSGSPLYLSSHVRQTVLVAYTPLLLSLTLRLVTRAEMVRVECQRPISDLSQKGYC